jgi:hypothetical protein
MKRLERVKGFIKSSFPAMTRQLEKSYTPHDRIVLEKKIFPFFISRVEFHKILFVGCESYTQHYNQLFQGKEYWTIEPVPEKRRYGAENHIIAPLKDIRLHFSPNFFDLILCNGVFLVGAMDNRQESEESFSKCFECLRSKGILMVGWNDKLELRPFPLEEIQSLKSFKPYFFPPLSTTQYPTKTMHRHVFNFYVKP